MGARLAFGSAAKQWSHYSGQSWLPSTSSWCTSPLLPITGHSSLTMSTSSTSAKVCTLDCTGTIMRVKGSIPRLYLGVLEDRLGVQEGTIPGVCENDLVDAFSASMKRNIRDIPCFGAGVMSSEEWWADVVRATFRGAGVAEESLESVFDEVFDELYHRVFVSGPAWELVPGAKEVIGELRAWCREDGGPLALGVISNFDERLHPLLRSLGVHDSFDFVLTSRECGSEKPHPHMFEEALRLAGARVGTGLSKEEGGVVGVHVGDTFSRDILGASGVGWQSVLITGGRAPKNDSEKDVEHVRVSSLLDVPGALGIGR